MRKVRARTTRSKSIAAVKSGARALMKTAMKVPKKITEVLKNSQKTKKRQEKQLQAIVSQRLHLPRRQPRRRVVQYTRMESGRLFGVDDPSSGSRVVVFAEVK